MIDKENRMTKKSRGRNPFIYIYAYTIFRFQKWNFIYRWQRWKEPSLSGRDFGILDIVSRNFLLSTTSESFVLMSLGRGCFFKEPTSSLIIPLSSGINRIMPKKSFIFRRICCLMAVFIDVKDCLDKSVLWIVLFERDVRVRSFQLFALDVVLAPEF